MADQIGILGFHLYMPIAAEMDAVAARQESLDAQVSAMAVKAARPLLDMVSPSMIDAVIYFGGLYNEVSVWQAASRIQYELGVTGAEAFEVGAGSTGCPTAFGLARSLMLAYPQMQNILVVGASKESTPIDSRSERSRLMFSVGDGAVAALIQRGYSRNTILETAAFTDPHETGGQPHPVTAACFIHAGQQAAERSGYRPREIRFAAMPHTNRSIYNQVMDALGVELRRRVYLDEYGQMSAIDPMVVLDEAVRRQLLSPGDLVILLSAGIGHTWAATALIWDAPLAAPGQ